MIAPLLQDLERFLLPNSCIICTSAIARSRPDDLVCSVCVLRMRPVGVGCRRCAQPNPPVGPCRFCREWPSELSAVRSAVWLDREARGMVWAIKYGGRSRLATIMAQRMASAMVRPAAGSLIVPVPTTFKRRVGRGYDQAELLAAALGDRWELPVRTDILLRVSQGGSQTKLTPGRRLANVANAYCAAALTGSDRRQTILVDDVLTTGATLAAASAAMVASGWTDLCAVTFARAEPYERLAAGH